MKSRGLIPPRRDRQAPAVSSHPAASKNLFKFLKIFREERLRFPYNYFNLIRRNGGIYRSVPPLAKSGTAFGIKYGIFVDNRPL